MIAAVPSRARILVVDDEPFIQEYLCTRLEREGYHCQRCGGVEVALAHLAVAEFDVVISDVNMPGRSGLELLREVRARYPHVIVLMATAVDEVRLAVQAMQAGAFDYLTKPLQFAQVAQSVRNALDRRRRESEIAAHRHQLESLIGEQTRLLDGARQQVAVASKQMLRTLGWMLEQKSRDVAGHSDRVSLYSVELAQALDYAPAALERLEAAAYVHDIGKLMIPDAILYKQGPLTPAETEIMRTHVQRGHELVSGIEVLAPFAMLVLTHQERFDGQGYPQGLAGEAIPMDARVFAVADTLDAMTSDRPYRAALPWQMAADEIRAQSGRQFDPAVVRVFQAIPLSRWMELRQITEGRAPGTRTANALRHAARG